MTFHFTDFHENYNNLMKSFGQILCRILSEQEEKMQVIEQKLFHAPINMEITGRISFTPLGKTRITTPFFTDVNLARQLS